MVVGTHLGAQALMLADLQAAHILGAALALARGALNELLSARAARKTLVERDRRGGTSAAARARAACVSPIQRAQVEVHVSMRLIHVASGGR